ncbi:hypothetical protein F5888DRAFT_1907803, partial [Russula emetica]
LPIQGICARYRGRPARARRGQNNRSVAQPAKYFRGAASSRAIAGKHCAVCCRSTALRSPYRHFCLAQIPVTQLPRNKSLLFLNSPRLLLTSSFILNFSPSLPFPPLSILHCTTILCLKCPRTCICTHTYYPYRLIPFLASNVLCRLALVLEIEYVIETILHAQRKERF